MKYGFLFSLTAILLAALAVVYGGPYYVLIWPAFSFALVAAGYIYFGPKVYGKSGAGTISPVFLVMLMPYLLYLWSMWYALRLTKRESAIDQLTETIFIGRRLLSHELPNDIEHVVDLTCEFNEPLNLRSTSYHSFQILDGFVPSADQLREWAATASRFTGNVYIHCAEGHGRTGLFSAVILLHNGYSRSPEEALEFIRSKRPQVRLHKSQMAVLNAIHDEA